jgi:uncharacterized protein (TIGR03083 family)
VTAPGPREEIDALAAEGAKTSAFLRGLDAPEWTAPTRCPPWDVREIVVHMTMMMEGVDETAIAPFLDVQSVKDRATWWDYDIEEDQAETLHWVGEAGSRLPEGSLYERWHSAIGRAVPAVIASLEDGDPVVQPGDNPILMSEYIATRVLEITIHSMDVRDAFGLAPDPSPEGLAVTMGILERRLGSDPRAMGFEDADFTLVATGRRAPTADDRKRLGSYAAKLPLLA